MTLAFVCVQLDKGLENYQLIPGQKVFHYLGSDKGRGSRQTVTKGDKGEGVRYWDFYGDILFEWPFTKFKLIAMSMSAFFQKFIVPIPPFNMCSYLLSKSIFL